MILKKSVVSGIHVGKKGIKVALLTPKKTLKHEELLYEDVYRSEEQNFQLTVTKMKLLKELKEEKVNLYLSLNEFIHNKFDLIEGESEKEIQEKIEKELMLKEVSYSTKNYITKSIVDREEKKVYVFSLSKKKAKIYINALKSFHIDVVKLAPDFTALISGLEYLKNVERRNEMKTSTSFEKLESVKSELIVDFNSDYTKLIFLKEGKLKKLELLDGGGDRCTQIVMKEYMLDIKEAEALKKEIFTLERMKIEETRHGEVIPLIQEEMKNLIYLISEKVASYEAKEGANIERVVLTGGIIKIKGIKKLISRELEKELFSFEDENDIDILSLLELGEEKRRGKLWKN